MAMDSGTMASPRSLSQILRAEAKLLVALVLAGLALAIGYLHIAEQRYAVTLVLVPTEASSGGAKALGGGLGSLASLAGVQLPGGADSLNFDLLPDAMVSRETAAELARDPAILRATFPSLWDEANGRWREPTSTVYAVKKAILSVVKTILGVQIRQFAPPGAEEMQEFLAKRLSISTDRKRPVITASILHADPAYAKNLLYRAWLVTDRRMKQSSMKRSTANIAYLSQRLTQTQALDYRTYLYTVMSQEEKRLMTTSSSLPYVAEPFGAPVASVRPASPNILFVLLIGPLAGLIVALGIVVIRRRNEIASILSFMRE
jgi:hypothetical protein